MRLFLTLMLLFATGVFVKSQESKPAQYSSTSSQPAPATPDVKAFLAAAHEKLEHGDPQEATAMLEQLVVSGKGSAPGVQHELGIAYYRTGKLLSAEKSFAQAMAEDPTHTDSCQMPSLS